MIQVPQTLGGVRLDAAESAIFGRQLEHIFSKTYDIVYPTLKARQFVPVSSEAPPGAQTVTYRQFDEVGRAKFISNKGKDLPRVDVKGAEFSRPVRLCGDSYGYDIQELRSAAMAGFPLDARRASAARRAVEELLDYTACFGSVEHGIVDGFLNNANITATGAPAAWAGQTPDNILKDVADGVARIVDATLGIEMPDTILLDPGTYTYISTKPRSSTSDTTILQYIMKNFPMITNIESWYRLATAGAADSKRMVIYRRSPEVLTHEIPSEFEQLPPQEQGLEFVINCIALSAGVAIYVPKAIDFTDGL